MASPAQAFIRDEQSELSAKLPLHEQIAVLAYARTSLDFGVSYKLSKNFTAYFNAKSLLNTPHAFYQGTKDRPIQREFYKETFQGGVRFEF